MIKAVILAGGVGSRLWPLSRVGSPKQFLPLQTDKTMFQATIDRLSSLEISSIVTVCNADHRFLVAEQLREVSQSSAIILEPVGRNTAPAIALAALLTEDDPLLLVMPTDHLIQDEREFTAAVNRAIPLANKGKLVTFGITPKGPSVDYGYIKAGQKIESGYRILQFVEKPSLQFAEDFLASSDYYWNSGTFLFRASAYLKELKKYDPGIFEICLASMMDAKNDLDFLRVSDELFTKCPAISIDYAVLEHTEEAVVVPMNAGWSDLGSWPSLWDLGAKDIDKNVWCGDVILKDVSDSYIRGDHRLIVAIGLDDIVIVDSKDAVLVAKKSSLHHLKLVVEQLEKSGRTEAEVHTHTYRPWGKYELVDKGQKHQVKRITVKPGGLLSLQKHYHRAEHWVVVSGVATITKGDEVFTLHENESTFIPIGVKHSLGNEEIEDLEIIEVQSGVYLSEDDIVRYKDLYGRV